MAVKQKNNPELIQGYETQCKKLRPHEQSLGWKASIGVSRTRGYGEREAQIYAQNMP
jgi:hypothetical protein